MSNIFSHASSTSSDTQPTGALTPVNDSSCVIRDLMFHGSTSSAGSTESAEDHSRTDNAISCQVFE